MIKYLEKSGRTMEDAIAAALAELGLSEDEISVEVLERAKSGFLGIGAQPAVVRVSYEVPDEPAEVRKEAPAPKKWTGARFWGRIPNRLHERDLPT